MFLQVESLITDIIKTFALVLTLEPLRTFFFLCLISIVFGWVLKLFSIR